MPIQLPKNPIIPPPSNSLADMVANTFATAVERTVSFVGETLATIIGRGLEIILDALKPGTTRTTDIIFRDLRDNPSIPQSLRDYITAVQAEQGEAASLLRMLSLLPVIGTYFQGYLEPMQRLQSYRAEHDLHTARFNPSELVTGLWRHVIGEETANSQLNDTGYMPNSLEFYKRILAPLLNITDIATLQWRGEISEDDARRRLEELGYSSENARLIQSLFPVIPSISDLVMMAVKEAFSPEIAQRFGQYEDFPEEVAQWAAKQGLSREWAQRYWAAHWDLPSATQGFEMFQRGIIGEDDLKLLLKALDVMPFWRDKLIQIAYTPFTRVDIRRMYDENVITEQEVYRTYRDIGYDDWHAQKLTEWTVSQTRSANKELTKQELLTGYRRGLLTEGEARSRLQELGYKQEDIDYYIRYTDWQRSNDRTAPDKALAKGDLVSSYKQGVMSRQELLDALSNLGYDETERNLIANLADAQMNATKHEENKSLAKSEVISAYIDKIISRQECSTMLGQLGYDADETEFLVALADFKITQNYRKDAVDLLHVQYVNGTLDDTQLVTQLNSLNLPDLTSQYYLYKWRLEREAKVVTPTFSQFAQMYKKNIINEDEFRQALSILGYKEPYLTWMYELVTKSAPTPTVPS